MNGKPNIILVLTDDQGYGDLGCTGNPWIKTPNIDNFYGESIRFTNYHVGPTCAPTRAGLFTGHYANSTGVWHTIGGRSLLRENEWTLAAALSENGYATGIFGKWHLGDNTPYQPHERGFQTSVTHGGGGISQTPDFWGNDYFDDTYKVNGEYRKFSGYCTDVFFNEALKYIEQNREQPFLCCITTNAPHAPYNVPKKYYDLYSDNPEIPDDRARFYGMITNIDENFARLLKKLDELNIADNTIVIFSTDNGTCGGALVDRYGYVTSGYNAGMRGKKCSEYEGGHRVPLFIRCPDCEFNEPRDIPQLAANVDLMPTILDLCGIDYKTKHSFHGTSLVDLLHGKNIDMYEKRVVVTDNQRVPNPVKWKNSCVMTGSIRLINGKALYDVSTDAEQRIDISAQNPGLTADLREEYEKWWDIVSVRMDDPVPIHLGEYESRLCSHDLRGDERSCAWNQRQVREGLMVNSYFEVEIEKSGVYSFELRRWCAENGRSLTEGITGDDIEWNKTEIQPGCEGYYTGGVQMDIKKAYINIQDNEYVKETDPTAPSAVFEVALKKGVCQLKTGFIGSGGLMFSAYYTYVRHICDVAQ